jgi:hypothetical protein
MGEPYFGRPHRRRTHPKRSRSAPAGWGKAGLIIVPTRTLTLDEAAAVLKTASEETENRTGAWNRR